MEEWIDILKDRLREAELPLPADDMEVFEAKYKADRRRRMVLPFVLSSVSVVAAAVAAFIFLSHPADNAPVIRPVDTISSAPEFLAEVTDPQPTLPVILSPHGEESPKGEESTPVPVILNPHGEESPKGEESTPVPVILSPHGEESPKDEESADFQDFGTPEETYSRRRPVVAPHLGGMRNDVTTKILPYSLIAHSSGHPVYAINGINTRMFNATHSVPVSFGIDISYPLNQHLAITSGLEAESYKSVFTSQLSLSTLSQRAVYLGIPLRLEWGFWQGGRFSSWFGAGGKVDHCIYARMGEENIRDNAFNLSLVANAGLRYSLTDNMGLYIAPQLSWFLKPEDPAILTYRTQNPLMFTVNAGLRFDL